MTVLEPDLQRLTESLDEWGTQYDLTGEWPERSVKLLAEMGGWRWNVPAVYGGDPVSHRDLLRIYEAISAGCMSTSLILTQRDGAVELIATSPNETMKSRWLPRLARGEIYTTVGISQLTTSKRGGGRLMTGRRDGDGYRLSGMMPWATGAERANIIVTGALLEDGTEILACVPTDREGIRVDTPDDLFVLTASRTSCVHCKDFRVEPDEVLRGPSPKVLSLRTPVKPLVTSACGVGVAAALEQAIAGLPSEAMTRFAEVVAPLRQEFQRVRDHLYASADRLDDPKHEVSSTDIRVRVNDVVIRLAIAALTLCKGSAFLRNRGVQRHVREALFFLVWSATPETQSETLARLICHNELRTPYHDA